MAPMGIAPMDLMQTAVSTADGAVANGTPSGDLFAALLSGLSGDTGQATGQGAAPQGGIPLPELPAAAEKGVAGTEGLDSSAALLWLQLMQPAQALPAPVTLVADAAPSETVTAASATPVGITGESVPGPALTPDGATGFAAPDGQVASAELPAVPGAQPELLSPSAAPQAPAGEEPASTTAANAAPVAMATEAVTSAAQSSATIVRADGPAAGAKPNANAPSEPAPGPDAAQATAEPVATATDTAERVVRTDGNAQHDGNASERGPQSGPKVPTVEAAGGVPSEETSTQPVTAAGAPKLDGTQAAESAEATAPAAKAAEPPAVQHVARVAVEQAEQGGGDAILRLDPPELGRVDVHVRVHEGGVAIDVRAERPEAARLLQDHQSDLASLLAQRGLDLSSLNVGVGNGQQGNDGRQQAAAGRTPRPTNGEFAAILGIDPSPIDVSNRLRAAYNPDGAHVYRI